MPRRSQHVVANLVREDPPQHAAEQLLSQRLRPESAERAEQARANHKLLDVGDEQRDSGNRRAIGPKRDCAERAAPREPLRGLARLNRYDHQDGAGIVNAAGGGDLDAIWLPEAGGFRHRGTDDS